MRYIAGQQCIMGGGKTFFSFRRDISCMPTKRKYNTYSLATDGFS